MSSKMEDIANLNFRGRTYNQAFTDALEMLFEEGLISDNENFMSLINQNKDIESELVMLFSVICEFLWDSDSGCIKLLKDNYESSILDKATGIDLEVLAEYFGIYRIPATCAVADVTFNFSSALDNSITIPKDLRIADSSSGIIYGATDSVIIPKGVTEYNLNFTSKTTGEDGRVSANSLTTIIDNEVFVGLSGTVSCYNESKSTGGEAKESDDDLRDRTRSWAYSIPRTTESAYRNYLRSVDGLKAFRLVPKWNGTGTLKVIVLPNNQQFIDSIEDYITTQIASIDDDVTVVGATSKEVDIKIVVNTDIDRVEQMPVSDKDGIRERIIEAIEIYIDGGTRQDGTIYSGLSLGEDFIPFECAVFIKEEVPELKNLTFVNPETATTIIDDIEYAIIDSEVITIDDDEIATIGTLDVTYE